MNVLVEEKMLSNYYGRPLKITEIKGNILVTNDKRNIHPIFVNPSTFPDELLHSIKPVWEKLYAYLTLKD